MAKRDLVRYREVRVADAQDDQKSALQILNAPSLAQTQEQFQEFVLSQIKRIIHGDAPGTWRDNPVGGGGGSLADTPVTDAVPFAYNTPSPLVLRSLVSGQTIDRACVVVQTPFNGSAPTLQVGTTALPGLVFGAADVDLQVVGQYQTELLTPIAVDDLLRLIVTATGATQGQGLLLYKITR